MLQQLVINDLALIDSLDIDFYHGMSVLTGETGAGKSILLGALGLILGDRADKRIIRNDNDKTDITAVFLIEDEKHKVFSFLKDKEIEINDNELFIRRTISYDGRSKNYINNISVPVQFLRDVGVFLVDIHGQHAHQSLSKSYMQREILDQFGKYNNLLNSIKNIYLMLKEINQKLEKVQSKDKNLDAEIKLLRYQIDEIKLLNIEVSTYHELDEMYKRITNSKHLLDSCQNALTELHESEFSVHALLSKHQHNIAELSIVDPKLTNVYQLLDNATIQVKEANIELKDYVDSFDDNSSQINEIEDRLDKLNTLAQKHKVKPENLLNQLELLTTQLESLEKGEEQYEFLNKEKQQLMNSYLEKTKELSKKRKAAAKEMSTLITEKMHELGMNGEFCVDIKQTDEKIPSQFGSDKIVFMVSTNIGQAIKPITKVASGGELSRLSLAIQLISSIDSGVKTLIFDEVDTGVSGGIAEMVGKSLYNLAKYKQVLCVTHLPQVASCGHHHYKVSKNTKDNETFTYISKLNEKNRIDEIARMLAGLTITEESKANAIEMLKSI